MERTLPRPPATATSPSAPRRHRSNAEHVSIFVPARSKLAQSLQLTEQAQAGGAVEQARHGRPPVSHVREANTSIVKPGH